MRAVSLVIVIAVLVTERLILRPVTEQDQAALLAHWTAPVVRRFLFDGEILTGAQVAGVILESVRSFAAEGYGLWAVREHGGPDLIGTAGLRPLEDLGLEVLYSLAPTVQGKGYASEAADAVVRHALHTLGMPHVLAEIDEGNTASASVAERLGMVPWTTVPGALGPMVRYRTTR